MSANGHGSSSEWQSYFISDFTSKDCGLHINHFPVRKNNQDMKFFFGKWKSLCNPPFQG